MALVSRTHLFLALGSTIAAVSVLGTYPGGLRAAYRDAVAATDARSDLPPARTTPMMSAASLADRITIKDGLITDLIAGRSSLPEVAEWFCEMNSELPGSMTAMRSRYRGSSDLETCALNVLDYVDATDLPPGYRRAVNARLTAEYRAMFGHAPAEPVH